MGEAKKKIKRAATLADISRQNRQLYVILPRLGGSVEVPVRFCSAAEKEKLDALLPMPTPPQKIDGGRPFLDDTDAAWRAQVADIARRRLENFAAWLLGPQFLGDVPLADQVAVMRAVLTEGEVKMIAEQGASPFEVTEAAVVAEVERIAPFDETPSDESTS